MADLRLGWLRNGHAVGLEDRYLFVRQLHVLQRSGVPLLSSLHALREQLPPGALRDVISGVGEDLVEGRTFSQALARRPQAFTPVMIGLIRAGESGGLLSEVLEELARFYEWEIDLRQRLYSAVQYPLIVLGALAAALTIIAVFVLPRFAQLFSSFQIRLPLQTRLLIALSEFLARYGWAVVLVALLAGAGWWAWGHTPVGRLWWHTRQLRLPVAGGLLRQLAMSRVARTVAALLHSGVPILETLALAEGSVNNVYIKQRLAAVRGKVQQGTGLATALKGDPLFPPIVVQMVATGEETGRMDELLHSVSVYYDQQVTYALKRLLTALEPLLLVIVGVGVLILATAVFLPMWDLVQIFKTGR